jgi:hypothetical protein
MIKIKITVLSILCFGQLFAQNTFYVRPKFEIGLNQTMTHSQKSSFLFYNNSNYIKVPYYDFEPIPMFFGSTMLALGLNVGVKFNNNNLLEIGWNQDETGSAIRITSMGYGKNNIYAPESANDLSTFIYNHRIEVLFQRCLRTKNEINNIYFKHSYLVFGSGIKINPRTLGDKVLITRAGSYDNIYLEGTHSLYAPGKETFFLSLGISGDLYIKNKYLFTSNITYTQGFGIIENTRHQIDVYENNTLIKTYTYNTYSNGSGFEFQISRRLQFYPWKQKTKKKDL